MPNIAVGSRLLDSVVRTIIIFEFFSKTTGWMVDCSTTKKGHDGRIGSNFFFKQHRLICVPTSPTLTSTDGLSELSSNAY